MNDPSELLEANRRWAESALADDPEVFARHAKGQAPPYLWIGCSDSRVPESLITGRQPGEIFVHRNVANLVNHSDLSCQSVMQYAVEVLRVEHIIVCGHYGCGGVAAALSNDSLGPADSWLRHIRDVVADHADALAQIDDAEEKRRRLCELNVAAQVKNVCHSTSVQRAWNTGQTLAVHGWIYAIESGRLTDLGVSVASADAVTPAYRIGPATR